MYNFFFFISCYGDFNKFYGNNWYIFIRGDMFWYSEGYIFCINRVVVEEVWYGKCIWYKNVFNMWN